MKKVEKFLKNLILNILLMQKHAKEVKGTETGKPSRVLLIRLNRIGDALVTTPLLSELRKDLNLKLYLLADKKNYFVFNNNPCIDKVLIFDKGLKGIVKVLKFIKQEKIDTVADLHDDVSTTVSYLVAMAKAPCKFGLEKKNRKIFTRTIPRPDPVEYHVVERLIQIAKLFSIDPEIKDANIHFYPSERSLDFAKTFLKEKFEEQKFLLGINISAGSEARFWGVERYRKLLASLKDFNCNLLVISAPGDIREAEQICGNEYPIFTSESYDNFGSVISMLNFLITPDTAAVHLASAFNIPVFGLYVQYDTDEMIWSPYKSDFEYVLTKEPNLQNVTFEEVASVLSLFLKKYIR